MTMHAMTWEYGRMKSVTCGWKGFMHVKLTFPYSSSRNPCKHGMCMTCVWKRIPIFFSLLFPFSEKNQKNKKIE